VPAQNGSVGQHLKQRLPPPGAPEKPGPGPRQAEPAPVENLSAAGWIRPPRVEKGAPRPSPANTKLFGSRTTRTRSQGSPRGPSPKVSAPICCASRFPGWGRQMTREPTTSPPLQTSSFPPAAGGEMTPRLCWATGAAPTRLPARQSKRPPPRPLFGSSRKPVSTPSRTPAPSTMNLSRKKKINPRSPP